jgi:hypothetical protein
MTKKFTKLTESVKSLLFEDSFLKNSNMDNLRTGGDAEYDNYDLPLDPGPQMSTQLSIDEPPVEDPEYLPTSKKDLASAVSVLAKELPNEEKAVKKAYKSFKKFVEDNKEATIDIVDSGGTKSPKEIQEARKIIRQYLVEALSDTDLYGNTWDEDEDSSLDYEYQEPVSKRHNEKSLEDVAKELGVSTSGVKKIQDVALGKLNMLWNQFPDDFERVRELALSEYADSLVELGLIDPSEGDELKMSEATYELNSFRKFMWDAFLSNIYKGMLRDAKNQEIPESNLKELRPGLYDRVVAYVSNRAKYSDSRKMKILINSLTSSE